MESHGNSSNRHLKLLVGLGIASTVILLFAKLLFFPAMNRRPGYPPKAPSEIQGLHAAIRQFEKKYNFFPVAKATFQRCRDTDSDFTFGIPDPLGLAMARWGNAEIMDILLVREKLPSKELQNFRKIKFMVLMQARSTNDSELGPGGIYRDPWGHPYVITLDLNGDGYSEDTVYSRPAVSARYVGKSGSLPFDRSGTDPDSFRLKAEIMIWSLGPDGKADPNVPADEGVNTDNILSWE